MSRVDNVEFNASNNKLLIDIKDIYLINQRPDESNENFIAEYWQNCFGFVFQIYPQWTRIADIQLNFCSFYRINFMLYLCYLWKLIFSILILLSQNVILCIATKMNLIAVTFTWLWENRRNNAHVFFFCLVALFKFILCAYIFVFWKLLIFFNYFNNIFASIKQTL